ncbi:MAG: transcriptional repressor [Eubacteriales bacterium]|nr:transcriptional repressor [Eubacteriales bacterium]
MAQIKHSRQREAIKLYLMSRKDHPTAEAVYDHVKKEYPSISLGTVYRNLTFLVDNGQAVKVPCDDGSIHFDANVNPHPHFQCRGCGSIIDLDFDGTQYVQALNNAAASGFNGTIEGNVTYFYGLCPSCQAKV